MIHKFLEMRDQLRLEVTTALDIWNEVLLEEFGSNLNYVYSKGSAVKEWDSSIDYVPMISDIDVHFTLYDYKHGANLSKAVASSLKVGLRYEENFKERIALHHHVPRPQVMCINSFMEDEQWVNPKEKEVIMLYGQFPDYAYHSETSLRTIDFNNLLEIGPILKRLYWTSIDRVGYELWSLMRNLTWKIGPVPARILTHELNENPYTIWSWNRSTLVEKLQSVNLNQLAKSYSNFYNEGWQLYLSNFNDIASNHSMITAATEVLDLGYKWALENKK